MALIPYVIDRGFAIYADKPVEAGFCRTLLFSLFVTLLNDERIGERLKEKIVRIIRTCAELLAGGLRGVLEGMVRAPKFVFVATIGGPLTTSVEEGAWYICHQVLTSPESSPAERWQAVFCLSRNGKNKALE